MNILKFYSFIFYRFKKYYELWQAVIVFVALISFNLLSILFLYLSVSHTDIDSTIFFLNDKNNYFGDRLYIGLVDFLPILLSLFLIYKFNQTRINKYFIEFEEEPIIKQKKRNRGRILYFIFTVLFFIFSVASSRIF